MAAATVSRPSRSGTQCEAVPWRAKLFLAAARRTSLLYPLYCSALFLGLRQGELLGLRWKDTNLALGQASIMQTVY